MDKGDEREGLRIEGVHVSVPLASDPRQRGGRRVAILRDVDLSIRPGEIHGLVGESGSGKTFLALTAMRLLPPGTRIEGDVWLDGIRLTGLSEPHMQTVRGSRLAMVFQEPMSALNPVITVGRQIADSVRLHRRMTPAQAREAAIDALGAVHLPNPGGIAAAYPHTLSGGERQRALIAMAIANDPRIILADEPTTALDVTIQAGILDLLCELVETRKMGLLLISHDLAVVGAVAHRTTVLYAGSVAESGATETVLASPAHPYTHGLLSTALHLGRVRPGERLPVIPGTVPPLASRAPGCAFAPRCSRRLPACERQPDLRSLGSPTTEMDVHRVACWAVPDAEGRADTPAGRTDD